MNLSGLDVIARGDDFEDRAASYEFRAWQWAFLHALDGRSELRDVAMQGGVDMELALDFVHEAQAAGLVHVVAMTLDEYRRSLGIASPESPSVPASGIVTLGDHFSAAGDTLGSYEHAVPAWMIDDSEPVAEPAAPGFAWHEGASADVDAVAEHHDDIAVEDRDADAAEPPADAVAGPHDDAVAEYRDDADAEHDDRAVAEQPGDAVAEHSAAGAVAELVSLVPSEPADLPQPASNGHPVSFSIGGDDDAAPAASANGHASSFSWEPMSLVASVVEPAPEPGEAEASTAPSDVRDATNDVPEGISIWLAPHGEAAPASEAPSTAGEPKAPEKGSITFSLSPEDAATFDQAPAEDATSWPRAAAGEAAPAERPAPVAMQQVSVAIQPPSFESPDALATPARPASAPAAGAPSAASDIVSSLISRALTFRIK